MLDSIDGVIALAWENESDEVDFDRQKRLVFRFGDEETTVKDKLYERDIVLEFEKKVVYEN
jgi:L,D-peptidoglycan transpeptidase YkuD (ErfK/YbiS/YcfS/YnhG family)